MAKVLLGTITGVKGDPGTTVYSELTDKPSINGVELNGTMVSSDLGLATSSEVETLNAKVTNLENNSDVGTVTAEITALKTEVAAKADTEDLVLDTDITIKGTDLGALSDGDVISAGTSVLDIIKSLAQKRIAPTYTKPTIALANNGSSTSSKQIEVGTTFTPNLRATFTQNDAGALTSLKILNGSTEVATGTASPLDYAGTAAVLTSNITFTAVAEYAAGAAKEDNLGNVDTENTRGEAIAAGSITSSAYMVQASRYNFYGTQTTLDTTSAAIRSLANKAFSVGSSLTTTIATGQQYLVVALYGKNITKAQVQGVVTLDITDSLIKSTVAVADARGEATNTADYNVFVYDLGSTAPADTTIVLTIA